MTLSLNAPIVPRCGARDWVHGSSAGEGAWVLVWSREELKVRAGDAQLSAPGDLRAGRRPQLLGYAGAGRARMAASRRVNSCAQGQCRGPRKVSTPDRFTSRPGMLISRSRVVRATVS
jgi:hypothetical protein